MYKNILLSVDLNQESSWRRALPTAVECSRAFGATLHLFTVVPDFGMTVVAQYFPANYGDKAIAEAKATLQKLSAEQVPPEVAVEHRVGYGTIYGEILDAARAVEADLIVISAHRPELEDYLLGPNAARVVRHADCSVMVVRE